MSPARLARLAWKATRRPDIAATRVRSVAVGWWERLTVTRGGPRFGLPQLIGATRQPSLPQLWSWLAERPYPAALGVMDAAALDVLSPDASRRLTELAERAMRHEVDLLGSGPVALGASIDWHTDFKSGLGWPPRFFRDIEYGDLDRPSDVKVAWDLSRLQWLMPAGQCYLLTGDERYAAAVRDVLDQWIEANPYGASVNWTCTMEVALRILTWTWFFHVCHRSAAWSDERFRTRFLSALWLHARYTIRHLEASPVAGNHYTANAAGLVFAGQFFGSGGEAARWRDRGWEILQGEIVRQTMTDGMNHEASVPYHRLVTELFHLPARYRIAQGLPVPDQYRELLRRMGRYTRAVIRPDGMVPVIGDADDARALPFGTQDINDHRYLPPLLGLVWNDADLAVSVGGSLEEVAWAEGMAAATGLLKHVSSAPQPMAFDAGGGYILRVGEHYAYVDCGPVGLRGRGGHGHNDCLSLEVSLDGVPLVSDCGSYVYTAAYLERNRFRSTDCHNTACVDGEEINRFVDPRNLWNLHDDARPIVLEWRCSSETQTFVGGHTGYLRLAEPVMTWRGVQLTASGVLCICDRLTGPGHHRFSIPLHLAPGVQVGHIGPGQVSLTAQGRTFALGWEGAGWACAVEPARVSPSYGIVAPTVRLCWTREGPNPAELGVVIMPRAIRGGYAGSNCRPQVRRTQSGRVPAGAGVRARWPAGLRGAMIANIAQTFATRLGVMALGMVVSVLAARTLGPAGRGQYASAAAFAALIVQFGNLGLHSANTYLVSTDRSRLPALLGNTLVVGLGWGALLGCVTYVLSLTSNHGIVEPELRLLTAMTVPLLLSFMLLQNLADGGGALGPVEQGLSHRDHHVDPMLAVTALAALTPASMMALCLAGPLLATLWLLRSLLRPTGVSRSAELFALGLRYGWRPYALSVAAYAVSRTDLFVIASHLGDVDAGQYFVALTMVGMFSTFPAIVGQVLFPRLGSLNDLNERWRRMGRTLLWLSRVVVTGAVVAALIATPLIRLLFGALFLDAVPAFRWLLVGAVLMAIHVVIVQYLNSLGYPVGVVILWIAAALLNWRLNLALVPRYGLLGGAWSSGITYGTLAVGVGFLALRYSPSSRRGQQRHDRERP